MVIDSDGACNQTFLGVNITGRNPGFIHFVSAAAVPSVAPSARARRGGGGVVQGDPEQPLSEPLCVKLFREFLAHELGDAAARNLPFTSFSAPRSSGDVDSALHALLAFDCFLHGHSLAYEQRDMGPFRQRLAAELLR